MRGVGGASHLWETSQRPWSTRFLFYPPVSAPRAPARPLAPLRQDTPRKAPRKGNPGGRDLRRSRVGGPEGPEEGVPRPPLAPNTPSTLPHSNFAPCRPPLPPSPKPGEGGAGRVVVSGRAEVDGRPGRCARVRGGPQPPPEPTPASRGGLGPAPAPGGGAAGGGGEPRRANAPKTAPPRPPGGLGLGPAGRRGPAPGCGSGSLSEGRPGPGPARGPGAAPALRWWPRGGPEPRKHAPPALGRSALGARSVPRRGGVGSRRHCESSPRVAQPGPARPRGPTQAACRARA